MLEISSVILSRIKKALDAELGTFAGGIKAIAIEPPEPPKSGTGLHVSIDRYPSRLSKQQYQFRVFLKQYDLSDSGVTAFDSALSKMRMTFTDSVERSVPYVEGKPLRHFFYVNAWQTNTLTLPSIGF